MASHDIWSRAGGLRVRDLLASLLAARLIDSRTASPLYVCSPYLTDFPLFDNAFGQFSSLFKHRREFGEKMEILFSDTLIELSHVAPVRIVTVHSEYSRAFLLRVVQHQNPGVSGRLAPELYHEKGLLTESFYVAGSMNHTYSGVYRRDEKITVHTAETSEGRQKIAAAHLEFQRFWKTREAFEVERA
jgi:hypothetical protein